MEAIAELVDDDDLVAVVEAPLSTNDQVEDPALLSDMIEEPDDDDIAAMAVTPQAQASKPMTADDLDELMESLEADLVDETATA